MEQRNQSRPIGIILYRGDLCRNIFFIPLEINLAQHFFMGAPFMAHGNVPMVIAAPSARNRVLVDVFFLCIMDAHKSLDRFDDPLSVSDQISVGILRREPIRKAAQ